MSLAVSRAEGVTVLTVTSDTSSVCPPLCQLLGALCYSPGLCSVSRRLLPQRGGPQAALGALWMITGVLHIGLGAILITTSATTVYSLKYTGCPFWLGGLFLLFGVTCVLSERYPTPIFVLLNGFLNLTGFALSITAVVLYSTCVTYPRIYFSCERDRYNYYYDYNWRPANTTVSPGKSALMERCQETRFALETLTTSILAVLITLSVLDLCLGLSAAFSFKPLKQGLSKKKPLLKEEEATPE